MSEYERPKFLIVKPYRNTVRNVASMKICVHPRKSDSFPWFIYLLFVMPKRSIFWIDNRWNCFFIFSSRNKKNLSSPCLHFILTSLKSPFNFCQDCFPLNHFKKKIKRTFSNKNDSSRINIHKYGHFLRIAKRSKHSVNNTFDTFVKLWSKVTGM